jgi:hypothetical protein
MSDVVVVSSSGSGQTGAGTGANKVTEVARIVGGHEENEIRAQALSCLNRVREHINSRDWRFTKTNAVNIVLVNGTATYTLPANFKSPSYARLLDTNGKQDHELRYVSDDTLTHMINDQEQTGRPYFYSLRNSYADGLVTVYPTPDASAATSWTLDVEYHKRIAVITDDGTAIDVPEEVNRVLAIGGQYELLMEREKSGPALVLRRADYDAAMQELTNFDRRISNEFARFRLRSTMQPYGSAYIRID